METQKLKHQSQDHIYDAEASYSKWEVETSFSRTSSDEEEENTKDDVLSNIISQLEIDVGRSPTDIKNESECTFDANIKIGSDYFSAASYETANGDAGDANVDVNLDVDYKGCDIKININIKSTNKKWVEGNNEINSDCFYDDDDDDDSKTHANDDDDNADVTYFKCFDIDSNDGLRWVCIDWYHLLFLT